MEKEIITPRTSPPPKAPKNSAGPVVRTMSMEKAKVLIRKTSKQHAELFRRLAR